ncbi:hypothetical protein VE01_06215 [Pseudogymnoascus verrucosus]|uniref:Homologous-pairing protein 2 winged helix domain-containing protein n=1 Tax=Pseudogymnoascus verrucosus TaxID=342668 RepID=A0A1B8GFX5_9PEZI|nr:uncharacterized protein VE01_06215 [Pseudogymnoascus verrucosus]OBT94749.1 hypothetical protein VE01_06215 [Pseudogymnoascus verrucosus]
MPPRKPPTTTSSTTTKPTPTDTQASTLIHTYLTTQNRPYSATEISSNLHNAVTKARTDKLLREMFERGEIAGRASGKQWVFWGVQDPNATSTPAELAAVDAQIAALRDKIPTLKSELKSASNTLSILRSAPTTSSLRDAVQTLETDKQDKEERLRVLRAGSTKPVNVEEREKVEGEWRRWKRTRDNRKRAYKELEAMLLDSGVIGKEALWDMLGIDGPA